MKQFAKFPHRSPSRDSVAVAKSFLAIDDDAFGRNTLGHLYRTPRVMNERARLFVFLRVMWEWSFPEITKQCGLTTHSTVFDQIKRLISTDQVTDYRAAVLERLNNGLQGMFDVKPVIVKIPEVPVTKTEKPRSLVHGYCCDCALCHPLRVAADLLANRPIINIKNIEPVVRPFYREALKARNMTA